MEAKFCDLICLCVMEVGSHNAMQYKHPGPLTHSFDHFGVATFSSMDFGLDHRFWYELNAERFWCCIPFCGAYVSFPLMTYTVQQDPVLHFFSILL